MQTLSIGQVAKQADLSIDTIRYYERNGLIAPPARRDSGYRSYTPEVIQRLRFIRRAKDLGFTLSEIGELMSLTSHAKQDMGSMKLAAQAKLGVVEEKLQELQRIRSALRQLIAACPGHGALDECPIVNALSQEKSS